MPKWQNIAHSGHTGKYNFHIQGTEKDLCATQSPWYKTLMSVKYFSSGVVICLGRKVFLGYIPAHPRGFKLGLPMKGEIFKMRALFRLNFFATSDR